MNETEELMALADRLILDFQSLPSVKQYHQLKRALEEDERLCQLKSQRENLQRGLRYLSDEKRVEAIKACHQWQEEYDADPLVISYVSAKEEILALIAPLTETKL